MLGIRPKLTLLAPTKTTCVFRTWAVHVLSQPAGPAERAMRKKIWAYAARSPATGETKAVSVCALCASCFVSPPVRRFAHPSVRPSATLPYDVRSFVGSFGPKVGQPCRGKSLLLPLPTSSTGWLLELVVELTDFHVS